MKNIIKSLAVVAVLTFGLTSCSEDETPIVAPTITELSVGSGSDHGATAEVTIGKDMHIEAKFETTVKVDHIEVEIHNEENGTEVVKQKFEDQKGEKGNLTFHKHIEIPTDAKAGEYHFHLKIVDVNGKVANQEKEIKLVEATENHNNEEGITIEELGHKHDGEHIFHIGEEMHVEAHIHVKEEIGSIVIEIHNEENGTEYFEKTYTDKKYVEKKEVEFHEMVTIPADSAEGHAHFHIKVLDKEGKELASEEKEVHIEKE